MTQQVMGFHYTLKNSAKEVLDTSIGATPLLFLSGTSMIIPALEAELLEMKIGDKKTVDVTAQNAYGPIKDDLKITVKRDQFPTDADIKVGDSFRVNEDEKMPPFLIEEIVGDDVSLNGNHPLAGEDLSFEVEVTEKRAATAEEITHGHAHGAGGHQH